MNDSLITVLKTLFKRDLVRLRTEIELYKAERTLWVIEKNIKNSGGNLCLHLIGNLNTYIALEFGKTNYVRDRLAEFSLKNIPKAELIKMINQTNSDVEQALNMMSPELLKAEYPQLVFKEKTSTEYLLVHLTAHLSYHLGQINYHRRLLDH